MPITISGGRDAAFAPYVGAGIGAAQVQVEARFTPPLSPVTVDDSATVLAYQLMAGVTIELGESDRSLISVIAISPQLLWN